MSPAMTMNIANEIAQHLRANGFTAREAAQRQVLCLAEEAGEFTGAYRRWAGLARRPGTTQDLHAELADVLITCYVMAAELGVTLDVTPPPALPADPIGAVLGVFTAVHRVVERFRLGRIDQLSLESVVRATYRAATALSFDLADAVTTKLDVIFSRGWRQPAASGVDGTPHTVPCGFGCGYLAHDEADLDDHEAQCRDGERLCPPAGPPTAAPGTRPAGHDNGLRDGQTTPASRTVRSLRHCGGKANGQ